MKNCICYNLIIVIFVFSFNDLYAGGGCEDKETFIIAPYSDKSPVDNKLILKTREFSSKRKVIKAGDLPEYSSILNRCHSVGLAWENGGPTKFYIPGYAVEPIDLYNEYYDKGRLINIPFSDIESIEIKEFIRYSGGVHKARVKVVVFPTISADELIAQKSTINYSTLKAKYSKDILVHVYLRSLDGEGYLQLVCNENDYSLYTPIARFIDLPKDKIISLGFENQNDAPIWWAIDEIIKDENYPYKEAECEPLMSVPGFN